MHQKIFERIANEEPGFKYVRSQWVGSELCSFLTKYSIDNRKVVAAGKNFASFDKSFLEKLPNFNEYIIFQHRCFDPAMFFWDPMLDSVPPSMKVCMERAGMEGEVLHTALEDAMIVVKLMRYIAKSKGVK